MDKLTAFWQLHHAAILFWAGAYILAATMLNRAWKRPAAPPWLSGLHLVLIDWPAALPSRSTDGRGIVLHVFGLQVTVPLLSISDALQGPPPQNVQVNPARGSARIELLLFVAFAVMVAFAVSGCCTSAAGSATCARKVVTGMYTAEGAAAAISRAALQQCENDALALTKKDELAGATALSTCASSQKVISTALNVCVNATGATASAIDAAEVAQAKDYGGMLVPLYAAGVQLARALISAGVTIPIPIPGVNQ